MWGHLNPYGILNSHTNSYSVGVSSQTMTENLILVVEDEASIAEVVSLYLKRAGYQRADRLGWQTGHEHFRTPACRTS